MSKRVVAVNRSSSRGHDVGDEVAHVGTHMPFPIIE